MNEEDIKMEMERMLTMHIGFSMIGCACLVLLLVHQYG